MPVIVWQVCTECHERKIRNPQNYKSRIIGLTYDGWPKRAWLPVCMACLEANPALWDTMRETGGQTPLRWALGPKARGKEDGEDAT